MAASSAEGSAVGCPLCDYTGSQSSVEAHISGSKDETHRGKVGREFREEFLGASAALEDEQGEETEDGVDGASSLEQAYQAQRAEVEEDESSEDVDAGGSEPPVETETVEYQGVPAGKALLVATAVFLVILVVTQTDLLASSGGADSPSSSPAEPDEEIEDESVRLVEG